MLEAICYMHASSRAGIVITRGRDWAGPSSPRPLLAVPNVTAYPSMARVPITVLLYNGPLLCGFNLPIGAKRVNKLCHCCNVVIQLCIFQFSVLLLTLSRICIFDLSHELSSPCSMKSFNTHLGALHSITFE